MISLDFGSGPLVSLYGSFSYSLRSYIRPGRRQAIANIIESWYRQIMLTNEWAQPWSTYYSTDSRACRPSLAFPIVTGWWSKSLPHINLLMQRRDTQERKKKVLEELRKRTKRKMRMKEDGK